MEEYSVLMSVYCREQPENLRLAVESMLGQTVAPSEFVLVCDGPLTQELDGVIDEFCGGKPGIGRSSECRLAGMPMRTGGSDGF